MNVHAISTDKHDPAPVAGDDEDPQPRHDRDRAIDRLRGLVIVLMVLDHVREFFHFDAQRFDPTNPLLSTPAIFATRWITHLCAPTFVMLAGLSIFLQKKNGKQPGELSLYLVTRGLWLIFLEVTIVSFGFNFAWPMVFLQVIAAIGASMVCMAFIAHLPSRVVFALGILMIGLSPFVLPLAATPEGPLGYLGMLFAPRVDPTVPLLAVYPLMPWLGIMCVGYGLGPIFAMSRAARVGPLALVAITMLIIFALLRISNGYGDPVAWRQLPTVGQTAMSFLNVSKYPPSPAFATATLGLACLAFLLLELLKGPLSAVLLTFGRTPLFTYILHVYLAHGLMLAAAMSSGHSAQAATNFLLSGNALRLNWGYPLPAVYAVWLLVVLLLYPLSRWFEGIRGRRNDWWLSYL